MKITRIKYPANHPILRGLEIDLKKDDGNPYDSIVFAGENGLGKTTILKSIKDFFDGTECIFEEFEYKENGISYKARHKSAVAFEVSENENEYREVHLYHPKTGENEGWGYFGEQEINPQNKTAKYSEAITAFFDEKALKENVSIVKNLIITLERQDNETYRKLCVENEKTGNPITLPSSFNRQNSKLAQFKNAYNMVFDDIHFDGIKSLPDTTHVIFKKTNGSEIDVEQLSTGEKQIVYRGTQMLMGAEQVSVALVDEPELSMHPRWQQKILNFYKRLFYDLATNAQTAQLFIATHSDHIISKAIEEENSLVIRLTKRDGVLTANKASERVLPILSSAEVNYLAFGIYSTDYHIQLFGQLQSNIESHGGNPITIKATDNSIVAQPEYIADPTLAKEYAYDNHGHVSTYSSLPAYVRNCIDHPGAFNPHTLDNNSYNEDELRRSTEFLRTLLLAQKNGTYHY